MITQETILARTHYGVQIYAHILRHFYPNETVIKVTERDCGLCRNPFTNGTPTLHIQIIKLNPTQKISPEKAVHKDILGAIPAGDCFTFAELYYNLSGKELLNKINQELNLHLAEGITLISFFKAPVTNTKPHQSITLTEAYHYITGNAAKQRTQPSDQSKTPKRPDSTKQPTLTTAHSPEHSHPGMTKHCCSTPASSV